MLKVCVQKQHIPFSFGYQVSYPCFFISNLVFEVSLEMVMGNPLHKGKDVPIVIEKVTEWVIRYGTTSSRLLLTLNLLLMASFLK